jgi:S1-C subfamily serine protease
MLAVDLLATWTTILVVGTIEARSLSSPLKFHLSDSTAIAGEFSNVSVREIAQQIAVRILAPESTGSGVIIERRGQRYVVLTCRHVVSEEPDYRYTIFTPDGRSHRGRQIASFGNLDLALVEFDSQQSYRVAAIGDNRTLAVGDRVYAAGFPSWHWINPKAIEDTRNWGLRAFKLTAGEVAMLPEKSLQEGYQIGYTNDIESGMSGGPVLNQSGQLIGINGGLKYPLQGIIAFRFVDGTLPSEATFQQMESLSWAIPIATFKSIVKVRH